MYETRIKRKYQERIGPEGPELRDTVYKVIMDMDDMVLLYDPETRLMVDVFSNKLETHYEKTSPCAIIVQAKTSDYAKNFNLKDTYYVTGYVRKGHLTKLKLVEINDLDQEVKEIFPSRLKVVSIA